MAVTAVQNSPQNGGSSHVGKFGIGVVGTCDVLRCGFSSGATEMRLQFEEIVTGVVKANPELTVFELAPVVRDRAVKLLS